MRSSARYGAGAAPCTCPSRRERALRQTSATSERSALGRRLPAPSSTLSRRIRERLVEELHRLEQRVGEPGLESLLRAQHAVLAQRVLDDELHGLLGADELRDELRPAPAGDEAEEDLRTSEVADRRGDRPVVAVQRDLDAAADRGAVDRGDGDERELADPAEELVARFAAEPRALGRDLSELADVGADGEDERLAGEEQARASRACAAGRARPRASGAPPRRTCSASASPRRCPSSRARSGRRAWRPSGA